jgi:hypothetical protein
MWVDQVSFHLCGTHESIFRATIKEKEKKERTTEKDRRRDEMGVPLDHAQLHGAQGEILGGEEVRRGPRRRGVAVVRVAAGILALDRTHLLLKALLLCRFLFGIVGGVISVLLVLVDDLLPLHLWNSGLCWWDELEMVA